MQYWNVDAYDYKVQAHYSESGIVWEVYERTADGWEKRKRGYDKRIAEARKRAHSVIVRLAEVRYGADYRVSRVGAIEISDVLGCVRRTSTCRITKCCMKNSATDRPARKGWAHLMEGIKHVHSSF